MKYYFYSMSQYDPTTSMALGVVVGVVHAESSEEAKQIIKKKHKCDEHCASSILITEITGRDVSMFLSARTITENGITKGKNV